MFDRLFGTFQKEEEEVVYGVTKPLKSWNPVWANLDYYADLWQALKQPMTLFDRLKLIVSYPGWMPERLGGYQTPGIAQEGEEVYDTSIPNSLNYYILVQFVIILLATTYFLFDIASFGFPDRIRVSGWIILSVISIGGLFEMKQWVLFLELIRLVAIIPLSIIGVYSDWKGILYVAIGVVITSILWLMQFSRIFRSAHL